MPGDDKQFGTIPRYLESIGSHDPIVLSRLSCFVYSGWSVLSGLVWSGLNWLGLVFTGSVWLSSGFWF